MGTNYYLVGPPAPWGEPTRLHIGKKSYGWVFLFRAYDFPHKTIARTQQWQALLEDLVGIGDCTIEDEYEAEISYSDFWAMVVNSKKPWGARQRQPSVGGAWQDEGYGSSTAWFS
jgi:hypothetical protein